MSFAYEILDVNKKLHGGSVHGDTMDEAAKNVIIRHDIKVLHDYPLIGMNRFSLNDVKVSIRLYVKP